MEEWDIAVAADSADRLAAAVAATFSPIVQVDNSLLRDAAQKLVSALDDAWDFIDQSEGPSEYRKLDAAHEELRNIVEKPVETVTSTSASTSATNVLLTAARFSVRLIECQSVLPENRNNNPDRMGAVIEFDNGITVLVRPQLVDHDKVSIQVYSKPSVEVTDAPHLNVNVVEPSLGEAPLHMEVKRPKE